MEERMNQKGTLNLADKQVKTLLDQEFQDFVESDTGLSREAKDILETNAPQDIIPGIRRSISLLETIFEGAVNSKDEPLAVRIDAYQIISDLMMETGVIFDRIRAGLEAVDFLGRKMERPLVSGRVGPSTQKKEDENDE